MLVGGPGVIYLCQLNESRGKLSIHACNMKIHVIVKPIYNCVLASVCLSTSDDGEEERKNKRMRIASSGQERLNTV